MRFTAAFLAFFISSAALAQNAGTVTNNAFAIGKGAGKTGFGSVLCAAAQIAVGQSAAAPICRTLTGDVTLSAAGATTLATVNANVGSFGSSTNCVTFTVNAKGLITAASQTACNVPVPNLTRVATSLTANVTMNSINTYFPGPSVAQGSTGRWLATGTVTYTNSLAEELDCKLWDGTTIIASGSTNVVAGGRATMGLSGDLNTPAGNIRIDCKNLTTNTGVMEFNRSGNSKDTTITAVRIQ